MRSDAELVNLVRNGDRTAYAVLVERYERSVRAVTWGVLADRHAAEDAVQEAFLTAYEKINTLRRADRFGPWLIRIAKRTATRMASRRRVTSELDDVTEGSDPGRNGQLDEESEHLLHLVRRLPRHERLVVMLRYFDSHDVQLIAAMTGRPVGTVTKQLSRAHRRLRNWLETQS